MIRAFLLLSLFLLALPAWAQAEPPPEEQIVADVSDRKIAITAGFSGADTTLFGALPENGDVILTVTGPEEVVKVRRKERVLGVWLNRNTVEFDRVPGFYWIAASRPLPDIAGESWLAVQRLGTSHLRYIIRNATDYLDIAQFQRALTDLRERDELFLSSPALVSIMGGRLYRADVHIPANAPTGEYTVTTYLLRSGALIGKEVTVLQLRKEGSMAQVSDIAENQALVYALLALVLALLAGWTGAVLMQRS
jgi:uncharacterized protein (TIGR02186 family)